MEGGVGFLQKPNRSSREARSAEAQLFYSEQLPLVLHKRRPTPFITQSELYELMKWKLARGKWRPRLLDFIASLDETQVKSTSERAFQFLPDLAKTVTKLSTLKGVGPATASAVLAAYAPDIAPFMSDEAMVAAIGDSKNYSLKQYLVFAEKLQNKAKGSCFNVGVPPIPKHLGKFLH